MKCDYNQADMLSPTIHRAAPRKRRIAFNETEQAAQAIGSLENGCEIFGLTKGQFSISDVIQHCLTETGPATVDIGELDRIGERRQQGALPFEFKPLSFRKSE